MAATDDSAREAPIPVCPIRSAIRIYEPPPSYHQLPLPLTWTVQPRPATGKIRMEGRRYLIRHWTAEEWRRTPEHDRPETTIEDDQGGRFAIEPRPKA